MDFELSADQVALRDGIRSLCEGRFPIKRVREGFDRAAHTELAEAGVFSLRADGFGVADAAVVFEELGRAVVPGPLVWLYLANGLVDGVAGGLEVAQRRPPWMVEHLDVLDTLLLVDGDGVRSVAAGTIAGAVPVTRPLDPLTPVHRVERLPAGEPVGDAEVVAQWRLEGAVMTAAFLVGVAQACTELSVAYAKERRQFDRPIGSFQAVKHKFADMLVALERARATSYFAALTIAEDDDRRALATSTAKAAAGDCAALLAKEGIQIHGGIGYTWEHDMHLYVRRVKSSSLLFGNAAQHRARVADLIGL